MISIEKFEKNLIEKYGTEIMVMLRSPCRAQCYCTLRQMYAYILWNDCIHPLEIAIKLNRDRSSVYAMVRTFKNKIKYDKYFYSLYKQLTDMK